MEMITASCSARCGHRCKEEHHQGPLVTTATCFREGKRPTSRFSAAANEAELGKLRGLFGAFMIHTFG